MAIFRLRGSVVLRLSTNPDSVHFKKSTPPAARELVSSLRRRPFRDIAQVAIVATGALLCAVLAAFAHPVGDAVVGVSSGDRLGRVETAAPRAGIPLLREVFGDSAVVRAGAYAANDTAGAFHSTTMRPFADGFFKVTSANQDTPISENFRLRDFLTLGQAAVWPKYLALREPLVDKLELVLAELRAIGIPSGRLRVIPGFRTPQYNQQGVGAGGRVEDSRHQFGDAADVYVVNGARDWMSDLNRDGRVDTRAQWGSL